MQVQPGMVKCRVPYLGHCDLLLTFRSTLKSGHILNTVLCMVTKLGMLSFIIVQFIYQQTSTTVQYKINIKCMFKDILYTTLRSLQNQTLDGRIMYLTGTLVCFIFLINTLNKYMYCCFSDVNELHDRRRNLLMSMLPTRQIVVRRENLVDDVIDFYRVKPDTIHHRLQVTFEGEELALDLEGVTREMFCQFSNEVTSKYFIGRFQKVPKFDDRLLFNGFFEHVGRIIVHGFVLSGYLPPSIAQVIYCVSIASCCSDEVVLQSFRGFVNEEEAELIGDCCENKIIFTDNVRSRLINLIGNYEGCIAPSAINTYECLLSVAKLALIAQPMFATSLLQKGLCCYPLLWDGVTEELVLQLLEQYSASPEKLTEMITYNHSDDAILRSLEERAKGFLTRYICGCSKGNLKKLLRFWISSDILCIDNLTVAFNSLDGCQRRPIANTCAATLQVSRMYLTYSELETNFNIVLDSDESTRFDSI